MEAVPRLPMICCDLKVSPSNTEFGPVLKKYIRDHYHEDPESYTKEIKELETLRHNAIKAPLDFTGCSILKKYYSQLQKLQSRFPMTDDGAACVPFMWTDIYSGVPYNITDIEYEEACILYNIGALHSKLGTMDSRLNAEGIKIGCTHFQCAAWAFQHLRDTYPQPKGSDMSHDLLTFFINVMLAQAQECILEKSMLDNRKSSITAKIAAQVVDYYKCALGIMVSGSPSTDTGSILDIVGSKIYKGWKKFIEFKMSYYTSISHLYMGNQAEENEKWGERVAWFQSAYDHLMEAFKIAKKIDRDDLDEALTFTNDVIGGKHSSSKKENDFVYHDKVPALSSLPELKGASLVKGIPFSSSDPEVSGPDIFARLVPMEAHETSSLYSEEKAKILRSVVSKIEGKNEELMAYLSSLQLESAMSFDDEDKVPQELIEKCAALSVRPTAIADLTSLINELLEVSKDVETSLKTSVVLLAEEDQKELRHQETFGKRGPSMITVDLKKECSKYEEAHKKAVESNNTLQKAVSIHIGNLTKLSAPLDQITESLPSACSLKTPENVKIMDEFNHLVSKVEEMRKQRQYLENQLRDALMKDDITKRLVTLDKKDDLQQTFAEELKKHNETLTYIDQNLTAQDNILCALTEANAHYADTRKALREIRLKRDEMVKILINSYDAYEDLMEKAKKGLEFYKKLQSNVTRLLTRIKSVTKVQDEERAQRAEAELRKGGRIPGVSAIPPEQHVPKLKDYLPYMNKRVGAGVVPPPAAPFNMYPTLQPNIPVPHTPFVPESMRQATLGGPASVEFDRSLKPSPTDNARPDESFDVSSMGVRPTPVGSEQTSVPAMCSAALSNTAVGQMSPYTTPHQPWSSITSSVVNSSSYSSQVPYQYPTQNMQQPVSSSSSYSLHLPYISNGVSSLSKDTITSISQNYNPTISASSSMINSYSTQNHNFATPQFPVSNLPVTDSNISSSSYESIPISSYHTSTNMHGNQVYPSSSISSALQNSTVLPASTYSGSFRTLNSATPAGSLQFPAAAGYSNSGHYFGSQTANSTATSLSCSLPNSGLASAVGPSTTSTSVNYQHASMIEGAGNKTAMPINSYALPYSYNQQSVAVPPVSSSSGNICPQSQTYSGWQSNYGYSASSNYVAPPSSYSASSISNVTYNSTQYYQSIGASVTASMDTKTNTLNSLHQYAVANSNVSSYSDQNMYGYMTNPTLKTSGIATPGTAIGQAGSAIGTVQPQTSVNAPGSVHTYGGIHPAGTVQVQPSLPASRTVQVQPGLSVPGVMQTQVAMPASGSLQAQTINVTPGTAQVQGNVVTVGAIQPSNDYISQNNYMYAVSSSNMSMYNSVPSYSYAGSSVPTFNNYNTYVSTNSNTPSNPASIGSVPVSNTMQNFSTVQSDVSVSSATNIQHNFAYPSQQNYQPAGDTVDSLSSISAAYGSNTNIPNQQLQAPIEPKPLASQFIQPVVVNENQINNELNSPAAFSTSIPKSSSTDLQAAEKRDFITPPPESVITNENDKSKTEVSQVFPVLQPKVIDLKAIAELKEKEPSHLAKDPLDDPAVCSRFASEVEKYEKLVDGLVRKSLNGTTPLDQKWKEFTDVQDKESRKRSISVARCCPLKNRLPDVMPYDCNRVKLTSAKDDYINASYLKDICPNCPVFVITQAPLPATFSDFWLMVWEQQVETLICLLSDIELKNHVYFPKERGQVLAYGAYEISLHSHKEKNGFVERMINMTHIKNRTSRVVVHLQFTEWPMSGVPNSPATLLQFISDTLSYYKQQRNLLRPIVVHCSAGIGRSGCFCIITAMVSDMNNGHGPRDVSQVAASVSHQRKFIIQDKDQLKFCYDTVLYYAQDLLMRRGILTTRASFDDKLTGSVNTSSHVRHPSEDFILGGGLAKLQSGIAKLGLSSDAPETKAPELSSKASEAETKTTVQDTPSEASTFVGNGDVKQDSTTCDSKPKEIAKSETESDENPEISKSRKGSTDKHISSITSLLDPSNFTLDATGSPAKRKITKENFANSKGSLSTSSSDGADPLSQLDPLWSLKR